MTKDLIIGFNLNMDYSCNSCRAMCCTNEYQLPLFTFEEELIVENYPEIKPKITSIDKKTQKILIRSNSCIFLSETGFCTIHSELGEHSKPLVCQVYPLIFVRYPEFIFVYQYPCKGMQWVGRGVDLKIQAQKIQDLTSQIDNYYQTIFSDQIDDYNPFMYINSVRIRSAQAILSKLNKINWNFSLLVEDIDFDHEQETLIEFRNFILKLLSRNEMQAIVLSAEWNMYKKSLFTWLFNNPFMLAVNTSFSILLVIFAILWSEELLYQQLSKLKTQSRIDLRIIMEDISWHTVEIVKKEWWTGFFIRNENNISKEWRKVSKFANFFLKNGLLAFPD